MRTGLLPSAHNRLLAGLQRSRELADYDAAVAFSVEDAEGELTAARTFVQETLELPRREGWIPPPS